MKKLLLFLCLFLYFPYCECHATPSTIANIGRTPRGVYIDNRSIIAERVHYLFPDVKGLEIIFDPHRMTVRQGKLDLVVQRHHLRLNGKRYGKVKVEDRVIIQANQSVWVNGVRRGSN